MKRFKIASHLFISASFLLAAAGASAQDVHFSQVQDMNIWYNPALKTNKMPLVHLNARSVKYQNITAYTSKAATIELPLISKEKDEQDFGGFGNISAGMISDNSSGGVVNVSAAMLAISYALPLNSDNTYLAAGFQGAYTFSRIKYNSYTYFPDQFDSNGPIGSAVLADPNGTGYTYGYFSLGVGAALFHSGIDQQWYIGVSVRHLNQPLTDKTQSASYRVPANRGIQAGYTTAITSEDAIGGYGMFSWQKGAYEHLIGALYSRNLGDSANSALYLGIGYRIGNALIPNIGFKTGKHRFAFSYEFRIPSSALNNYNRRALEFSYMLNL